jgi:hypothetical protein
MEPSSEALVAETQAAEVVDKSELHKQLVLMKQEIDQEIDSHGQPLCYLRGDFFHRPCHPVFALHNSVITGLDPTQLYLRRVCIWLPYLLPGSPSRYLCTCGRVLSRNGNHPHTYITSFVVLIPLSGYNDDPIARRVRDIPDDFFLYTNRFICDVRRVNDTGCGTSWQGTDPHILAQLPRHVQAAFPGKLLLFCTNNELNIPSIHLCPRRDLKINDATYAQHFFNPNGTCTIF